MICEALLIDVYNVLVSLQQYLAIVTHSHCWSEKQVVWHIYSFQSGAGCKCLWNREHVAPVGKDQVHRGRQLFQIERNRGSTRS